MAGANSMILVKDCTIETNDDFGVYMDANLLNCIVRGTTAGEGVNCSGGTVRNSLIYGNSNSAAGGGLVIGSGCKTAMVSACTIISNIGGGAGSGIRIEATTDPSERFISISSCIIYSNGVSGTDDVYDAASVNADTLQYSCVGTNPESYFTGAGIIVADPRFKNFDEGNYRLGPSSPCVNAGSNETWMTNSYDLDGITRIRYVTVDMGAYERIHEGTVYCIGR